MKKHSILWISIGLSVLVALAIIVLRTGSSLSKDALIIVGHTGNPILSPLYVSMHTAREQDWSIDARKFQGTSEIGYALLAGTIDAGFLDIDKAKALHDLDVDEVLEIVGSVTFPYGATLVLRKDLDLRLNDLNGKTIAIPAIGHELFDAFNEDLDRLSVTLDDARFVKLSYEDMLAALEARVVHAALLKGSHAALAEIQGHPILYQNWDLEPGNECCPAIVDQLEYFLVVNKTRMPQADTLQNLLLDSNERDAQLIRAQTAARTGYPLKALQNLPIASYERANELTLALLLEHSGEDHHD